VTHLPPTEPQLQQKGEKMVERVPYWTFNSGFQVCNIQYIFQHFVQAALSVHIGRRFKGLSESVCCDAISDVSYSKSQFEHFSRSCLQVGLLQLLFAYPRASNFEADRQSLAVEYPVNVKQMAGSDSIARSQSSCKPLAAKRAPTTLHQESFSSKRNF
jgi:hypothetical protein